MKKFIVLDEDKIVYDTDNYLSLKRKLDKNPTFKGYEEM